LRSVSASGTAVSEISISFVAHPEQLDALYGPMPGRAAKPVVLVEDSKLSRAALTARAHWLTVEWLPEYTPN
jgi:hypothetical protein